jgi:hypothetical protein
MAGLGDEAFYDGSALERPQGRRVSVGRRHQPNVLDAEKTLAQVVLPKI